MIKKEFNKGREKLATDVLIYLILAGSYLRTTAVA
jgi:hypothetical protein